MTISDNMLAATEPVTIALVVFVMLTIFLLLILILLGVSKSFRAFFFREDSKKKKAAERKKAQKPAVSEPVEVVSEPMLVSTPAPRGRKSKKSEGLYDGVPTVPLNMPFPSAESPKITVRQASPRDGVRTVEIPRTSGNTYTPRTGTFARDRNQSIPSADTRAEQDSKKITRRAAPVRSAQKDDKK